MQASDYRWTCSCCGKAMTGLPLDISYSHPLLWDSLDETSKARSKLGKDFCLVDSGEDGIDRYIRCVLPIPVIGLEDEFCFGLWMSVSEKTWDIYNAEFDSGTSSLKTCFGYLGNGVLGFPNSFLLHANVEFSNDNQRPRVYLREADHDLVRAQYEGVDIAQVERWIAATHRN